MADQATPGAGHTPAPGTIHAAARTYWRTYRLGVRLTGEEDLPCWEHLDEQEQSLVRAAISAVLALYGPGEAQARAIRLTARVDELEAQAEALTHQLIAAEEALALVGWDQVAAPYALTDPGPDIPNTPWDEL